MTFTLSYLFYAGIILPTVVTLALFVFFVICWRKQSARKAVLTKPYDPHGTMRRLGIPNRPPPPPVFIQRVLRSPPGGGRLGGTDDDEEGGEDNAAYDMSRSPSAETNTGGNSNRAGSHPGHYGHHHQRHHQHQLHLNPNLSPTSSGETYCCNHAAAAAAAAALTASNAGTPTGGQRLEFHSSPSGELDITGRLTFHTRLDSGLSEPGCDSPGGCSNRGGGGVVGGIDVAGGGGGVGLPHHHHHHLQQQQQQQQPPRDRPQSQASHSSHSTDSEDSGFRSSRSGQFVQTSTVAGPVATEPPALKRSRSAGRGKGGAGGRGFYHKAATSSPESETEPSIQLTPTALWPHHHTHHTHHPIPTHPQPPSNQHSPLHGDDTSVKNTGVDLNDIGTHIGWKYLQDLASPGHQQRGLAGVGGRDGGSGAMTTGGGSSGLPAGLRQTLTCHQSMTMAQVHNPRELDNPDVFGFSVV